jgi:hypothetical protein
MDTIGAARSTNEFGFQQDNNLNIETIASHSLLPPDRTWAIRFKADGTIMIVVGMRDYGRGLFSGYFAALVSVRLGVPYQRVRIYYSATHPAVLHAPSLPTTMLDPGRLGPIARAAAEIIARMCEQVIEKGRSVLAAMAGVGLAYIGFDQSTGRHFFVMDRVRSSILEMTENARGGPSSSAAFWKELHQRCNDSTAQESRTQSMA